MTPGAPNQRPDARTLRDLFGQAESQYLRDLETLVNIDCGTFLWQGVNQVADLMQERFRSGGWSVERLEHRPADGEPRLGDVVIARLGDGRAASTHIRRVLMIGHMDTVFPQGTASARPFTVRGSRAFGPGVNDMKGGLLSGFYAVDALRQTGLSSSIQVTYVCNPDEEIGSPFSGPVIKELARGHDVCFVLEAARESGAVVSARKGVADVRIQVTGRAAHAGVEPERGRSAILQAAHTTIALHDLIGRWPGVTVNVGVCRGGIRPNVVAETCELQVDVRAVTGDSFRAALEEIERVAKQRHVPDISTVVEVGAGFPPMEKTEATERLVAAARNIAAELGFRLEDTSTGGASDANPVAGMGVPTLDGLGPIGGAPHAPEEWLDLESVAPRTALLGALIASSA